jgi:catechol 2,3-dioxygenase-like lactoylglutathione lyase family enzyme
MEIKFAHNVIFIHDIDVSKHFYRDILGIKLIQDHKIFLLFENDFAIHQAKEVIFAIYKSDKSESEELQGRNNIDIYFETDELERAYQQIIEHNVEIIHPIEKQSWGQRVIRFYDPDNHIVEIGEPSFIKFK